VDEIGHWFLMVVAVEDRKLYLLDSHLVAMKVDERHRLLKKIVSDTTIYNYYINSMKHKLLTSL